ncbi:MAG TPA: TIGR01777 family oxidoreductase [Candidatus Kapabacteria bacterium]|nr:TIGR01777 family oxidoreductase [Candidatus Kapabacteria bacterium]
MRILISGSTGFIGSALTERLQSGGHNVVRLVRSPSIPGIIWNPVKREIDSSRLEGFDAVVNLSGESINGRWTAKKKRAILESRIVTGEFLTELIGQMKQKPTAYISASAIGYYGNRGDEELTELSAPGDDFLADVCIKWEAASKPMMNEGIRVVHIRNGLVLSPNGGALQKLLTPFKLGLGGPVGSGKQWWSWVGLDDLVRAYEFVITNANVSGAVNGVAPNTVRNKEFVKALGKALHRPVIFPLPSLAIKLGFGEMGESLLLGSQRVIPKVLMESGFEFTHSYLERCLSSMV